MDHSTSNQLPIGRQQKAQLLDLRQQWKCSPDQFKWTSKVNSVCSIFLNMPVIRTGEMKVQNISIYDTDIHFIPVRIIQVKNRLYEFCRSIALSHSRKHMVHFILLTYEIWSIISLLSCSISFIRNEILAACNQLGRISRIASVVNRKLTFALKMASNYDQYSGVYMLSLIHI